MNKFLLLISIFSCCKKKESQEAKVTSASALQQPQTPMLTQEEIEKILANQKVRKEAREGKARAACLQLHDTLLDDFDALHCSQTPRQVKNARVAVETNLQKFLVQANQLDAQDQRGLYAALKQQYESLT